MMYVPRNVQLTKWGELQLSIFPVAALEYADRLLPSVKSPATPWQIFMNLSREYCKSNGISIDWASGKRKLKDKPLHEEFYVKHHKPINEEIKAVNEMNPKRDIQTFKATTMPYRRTCPCRSTAHEPGTCGIYVHTGKEIAPSETRAIIFDWKNVVEIMNKKGVR